VSTYHDVKCLDCKDYAGLHLRSGEDVCAVLAHYGPLLGALRPVSQALGQAGNTLEVRVWGECGTVDLEWFRDHGHHNLLGYSEYGDLVPPYQPPTPPGPITFTVRHEAPRKFVVHRDHADGTVTTTEFEVKP